MNELISAARWRQFRKQNSGYRVEAPLNQPLKVLVILTMEVIKNYFIFRGKTQALRIYTQIRHMAKTHMIPIQKRIARHDMCEAI